MSTIDFSGYLTKQLENRSAESGRRIRTTAQTLRTVAQELREDATTAAAADFAERGAEWIDRVGSYLERTDFTTMMADAERFSREQPLVVAAAGLATGMLASRLIRATTARRSQMSESVSEPSVEYGS